MELTKLYDVKNGIVNAFSIVTGHRIHWVKPDEIPVGGFTQEEFVKMQEQIANDNTHVVLYETDQQGKETDTLKFMARISQILYIA